MIKKAKPIEVQVRVKAPLKDVWHHLLHPASIQVWNHASDDWETSTVEVDLKVGGRYFAHMHAKDHSMGFDFVAIFKTIEPLKGYTYVLEDGRTVVVSLKETKEGIMVTETFDPENENPRKMQQEGWQSILNSFQQFVEKQVNQSKAKR